VHKTTLMGYGKPSLTDLTGLMALL